MGFRRFIADPYKCKCRSVVLLRNSWVLDVRALLVVLLLLVLQAANSNSFSPSSLRSKRTSIPRPRPRPILQALVRPLTAATATKRASDSDSDNDSDSDKLDNHHEPEQWFTSSDYTKGSQNTDYKTAVINRRTVLLGTAAAATATATATATSMFPGVAKAAATPSTNALPTTTTATVAATTTTTWTLEGGVEMPLVALNTVGLSVEDTQRAVEFAYRHGIRHVDFHPGKERDGVAAFLSSTPNNVPQHLFLTTKIRKAPPGTLPKDAAEQTRQQIADDLKALGVTQVDMLLLRDSPDCSVIQAQWAVLEEALAAKQTRSLGVINFCQSALTCLLQTATIKPAVHYYMLHVGMGPDAHGLRTFGESKGIRTFAYGAVGEPGPNPELLSSPILQRIAKAHGKSPEQVALKWVLQSGTAGGAAVSVRPTTEFGLGFGVCSTDNDTNNNNACEQGIIARASSLEWSLTPREMATLDAMTSPDDNPTLFSSAGCPGAFVMPK